MKTRLLILLSLLPLAAMGRNDWYEPPMELMAGMHDLCRVEGYAQRGDVAVRFAPVERGFTTFTLYWCYADDANYCSAKVAIDNGKRLDDVYTPQASVTVEYMEHGALTVVADSKFDYDDSYVTLKLVYDGYAARLYAGCNAQRDAIDVPFAGGFAGDVLMSIDKDVACQRITAEFETSAPAQRSRYASVAAVKALLARSTDPVEGMWLYLDRDVDQKSASIGGKYTLATVKNDDGGYDILYIEGADINCAAWQPLDVKGRLTPTPFQLNYDLRWTDANHVALDDDNNAQISDDGAILTLRFPVYKSQMRFRRIANGE